MTRILWLPLVAAALPATGPAAAEGPQFENRSGALPVAHSYLGPWEHFVGGGVAVLDCNGDALPDFLAAGGTEPARLFVNGTAPGAPLAFASGEAIPEVTGVTGAYPLDIDSDGVLDLAILRVGANQLWQGQGDCSFRNASADWGLDGGVDWTTGFTATWEAGNDWPTLVFASYVDRSEPDGPFGACGPNRMHRPVAGGGYGPVTALAPGYCALSVLFSDWQRRGVPDLRVSNDRHYHQDEGEEQMWRMPELTLLGPDQGWDRLVIWGMGIASEDITGDERPDVLLTSMGDQVLQLSDAEGFELAPYETGITAQLPHVGEDDGMTTGWHAEFADVDNDGLSDLFIAKGNVDEMQGAAMRDPDNLLMQQSDGTFAEAAAVAGVASVERGRGAALADFDADGRLDLVVVNRRAPIALYENTTDGAGGAVLVTPRQTGANGFAIGGWVELRDPDGATRIKELTVGGGHAGDSAGPLHFGLGDAGTAELRVIWPDGAVSDWVELAAGQSAELWRGDAGSVDLRGETALADR